MARMLPSGGSVFDFVTTARIHSSSFPPPADSAALLVFDGGWKATFRPGRNGSCLCSASLRALGSREKGIYAGGPTEFRGGTVIETPLEREGLAVPAIGVVVPEGDWPRGRLFRFSAGV